MIRYVSMAALCVIAVALAVTATVAVLRYVRENRKSVRLEGRVVSDAKRLIWRVVNTGGRNISLTEIGIRCGEKTVSYRPLYAAAEDADPIPCFLQRGEVVSYRKDMERFRFRAAEEDALKVSNPYIYFYVKDAEGTVYAERSEYKFVQYLTMLIGGGK